MSRLSTLFALACAILTLNVWAADSAAAQDNPVIQWNKTLLTIVRTPGAQPATIHRVLKFDLVSTASETSAVPGAD